MKADLREFWVQADSVGELEIVCRGCVDLIEPELSIGWSWPTVAQIVAAVDTHHCRRVIQGEAEGLALLAGREGDDGS